MNTSHIYWRTIFLPTWQPCYRKVQWKCTASCSFMSDRAYSPCTDAVSHTAVEVSRRRERRILRFWALFGKQPGKKLGETAAKWILVGLSLYPNQMTTKGSRAWGESVSGKLRSWNSLRGGKTWIEYTANTFDWGWKSAMASFENHASNCFCYGCTSRCQQSKC